MSQIATNNIPIIVQVLLTIVGLVIATIVAWQSLIEYRASTTVRRAEWLHRLYHEFYVEPHLKEIRDKVDSDQGRKKIEAIIQKPENDLTEEENVACTEFNDYLNFFEFMMVLKKTKALTEDDINDMFKYYLSRFALSNAIKGYLQKEGYELLDKYVRDNF